MHLSATVTKHVGILMAKMNREMPAKQNTENIISLEALRISGISTMLRDGKWPTTHNVALFLVRTDSRVSCQLVLSTMAHFHLKH